MKERNLNLDLIRCLAIFSVFSIHFISHSGFYELEMTGFKSFIIIFFRILFMICVPLFLLLTGYLMNKKSLNKKYYFGIVKVIFIFLCAKLFYLIVDGFYFHEIDRPLTIFLHIFSYSDSVYNDYSWYVNMYFGLFALIPFLNLIYNNLKTKKHKQILLATLILLTLLPTLNFKQLTIFPNWWVNIYPLTYYFTGAYIKEFGFNIKKSYTLLILFLTNFLNSICYFILFYNKQILFMSFNEYYGLVTFIIAIFMFGFILNLNLSRLSQNLKNIVIEISKLSFGMYLFSFIVDKVLYDKFINIVKNINDRLIYYFLVIPTIFLLTFCLSYIFNFIYNKFIQPKIAKLTNK